ncbi:MAG TPA: MauE/DoxX family redox-associated membrane protein [Gemmataceae bacterium]
MNRPYRVLAIVLGSVLLLAAGLKLYGLQVSAVPRAGPLYAPWVQMAVLQWEVVLGLWLVSGKYPLGSWLAAVGTFAAFAGVSGYLGWIGQADCGCFGSVQASPWHAFAVDVLALMLLARARPALRSLRDLPRPALRRAGGAAFLFLAGAAVMFGLLAGLGAWTFGSLDAALARVRGERISVRPGFVDVGRGVPGQSVEAVVELVNRTDRPVRVIGGTSDCSCVTTYDLPVTLEPGEPRPVSIHVRLPGTPGLFNRQAFFWTDDDQARTIVFPLTGRIEPPAPEPADGSGG